jgi:hypothetical protein
MEKLLLPANVYVPTSPKTGLSGKTLLRLKNMVLVGQAPDVYLECYNGSFDMSETIPVQALTGTVDGVVTESSLVGTGTFFTTELRSGQRFWLGTQPLQVDKVIDDENITLYQALNATSTAATGYRLPVMSEMDRQRETQIQGNAIQFDKGNILGAGWGTVRVNGQVLQGDSMVLTGSPQIAYFDPATGNYDVQDVGFTTPTIAPTLTEDLGTGTKGMQPGEYSLRLVPSTTFTGGYSNPGPRANVTLTAANSRIKVDVSAVAFPTGSDQWDVYATQLGVVQVNQGPWNFVRSVASSEIAANVFYIEYLNAEISRQGELEFDNNPPPDAGFVNTLQGYPQWISCNGKFGASPGPSLVPATPQNLEGAPAIWNVTSSPPEDILGVVTSLARLYLLCAKTLQQGVYAPTGDPLVPPTQIRAYWGMGFGNPYQVVFVLGLLIGYSTAGPTRSTADLEKSDEQFIGAAVVELTKNTIQANWMLAYDPNPLINAVCFFYPAWSTNDDGWLTTRVLVWGLNQLNWIGDILIESTERDMVVCGVATVDNVLYFLAGGRGDGIGSIQFDTFRWNSVSGDPVDYYAVYELQATEVLDQNKTIKRARVNGKWTNGQLQIYGFDSNQAEDLTNLETGTNAQITISLGTVAETTTSFLEPFNAPNNYMFTARFSGTYNGSDEIVDRLNGCALWWMPSGVRR